MSDLPNDFDYNIYLKLNLDLNFLTKEEAEEHYLKFGKIEKREYKKNLPDDFDYESYINFNPDLNLKTKEEIRIHYLLYGKIENRFYKINLPDDFNYLDYLSLNPDLSYLSEEELKNHYFLYGKRENRSYKKITSNNINDDNLFFKFLKNSSNNIFSKYQDNSIKIETYDNKSKLYYNELIRHQNIKLTKYINSINDIDSFILIIDC